MDQPVANAIPGTDDAQKPFFSLDGYLIGFVVDNTIYKMFLGGGLALPLAKGHHSSALSSLLGRVWGELFLL
jgi:hypothetical protein